MAYDKLSIQILQDVDKQIARRRRDEVVRALAALNADDITFVVGEPLHVCGESFSLLLRCVPSDDEHVRYTGTLLAGFPAGEEVVGIFVSLVDANQQIIARGTTGTGGRFSFELPTSVSRRGDQVQLRIGSTSVLEGETERFGDCLLSLTEMIQAALAGSRNVSAEPLAALDELKLPHVAAGFAATQSSNYTLAAAFDSVTTPLERSQELYLRPAPETYDIHIRCPAELMPFGVGCLFFSDSEQGVLLAAHIVFAPKSPRGEEVRTTTVPSGEWSARLVRSEIEERNLECHFVPATEDSLSLFAPFRDDIKSLQQRANVKSNRELCDAIGRLLRALRERDPQGCSVSSIIEMIRAAENTQSGVSAEPIRDCDALDDVKITRYPDTACLGVSLSTGFQFETSVYFDRDSRTLVIEYADHEMPFGVACVFGWNESTGGMLGNQIITVERQEQSDGSLRRCELNVTGWFQNARNWNVDGVAFKVVPAQMGTNLALFRPFAAEIRRRLDDARSQGQTELAKSISRLLDELG